VIVIWLPTAFFSGPQDVNQNITKMLDFALTALRAAQTTLTSQENSRHLKVRIGVHAGSVMAGVICVTCKPHFDIWGDAVNIASRMESTGEPDRIQVTDTIAQAVDSAFYFVQRPTPVMVKGKGLMTTWFLHGRRANFISLPHSRGPEV